MQTVVLIDYSSVLATRSTMRRHRSSLICIAAIVIKQLLDVPTGLVRIATSVGRKPY